MKNILHLSDLHLSVAGSAGFNFKDAISIIEKLIEDVKSIEISRNIKFDTVFFTGDLVFSGKKEEFECFENEIQNRIINALNISIDDFYVIPGNHDVSRGAVKITEKAVRVNSVEVLDELFNAVDNGTEDWDRLNNYFEYDMKVNLTKDDYVINGKLLKAKKIKNDLFLVFMNSAWLAQDNFDKDNLFITSAQIEKFINARIPRNAKIILLTHHPID